MNTPVVQPEVQPKTESMRNYLVQQGFFQNEINIPAKTSLQMKKLFLCAQRYLRDRKLHRQNPLSYLEAISYCVLRRPYNELETTQQKALANFVESIVRY